MAVCLDASAAVAAFMPDPSRPEAKQFVVDILRQGERLVAPSLLFAETTSVLRRHVHLGVITHDEAVAALEDLIAARVYLVERTEVYFQALELARRVRHARAYDVQYLAVAQMETCPVVTLDRGLHDAARTLGIAARLVA